MPAKGFGHAIRRERVRTGRKFCLARWLGERLKNRLPQRRRVAARDEPAIAAAVEDLTRAMRAIRADDRRAAGERLDEHIAESFMSGRHDNDGSAAHEAPGI